MESFSYNAQFDAMNLAADHFFIDDLLDYPNDDDDTAVDGGIDAGVTASSTDSSAAVERNEKVGDGHRGIAAEGKFDDGELCVPYDDVAELEWLSNFVDESFSSEFAPGMKTRPEEPSEIHHYQFQPEPARSGPIFGSEISVPAKARSKRSRAPPGNWTSRLMVVSPTQDPHAATAMTSSSQYYAAAGKKTVKPVKKESQDNSSGSGGGEGRRCLHCATDKTPQWRSGPMGPKTLCNACGVRYKSGRLVPEYRPAASPTFVLTKHSNSHRKVMELRRQKELMREQQHQQQFLQHHQNMMFDVSNGEDYLIHQHVGPDFRQLI